MCCRKSVKMINWSNFINTKFPGIGGVDCAERAAGSPNWWERIAEQSAENDRKRVAKIWRGPDGNCGLRAGEFGWDYWWVEVGEGSEHGRNLEKLQEISSIRCIDRSIDINLKYPMDFLIADCRGFRAQHSLHRSIQWKIADAKIVRNSTLVIIVIIHEHIWYLLFISKTCKNSTLMFFV